MHWRDMYYSYFVVVRICIRQLFILCSSYDKWISVLFVLADIKQAGVLTTRFQSDCWTNVLLSSLVQGVSPPWPKRKGHWFVCRVWLKVTSQSCWGPVEKWSTHWPWPPSPSKAKGGGRRADVLFNPFVGWVYESIQPSCLILKILRLFMNHTSQYWKILEGFLMYVDVLWCWVVSDGVAKNACGDGMGWHEGSHTACVSTGHSLDPSCYELRGMSIQWPFFTCSNRRVSRSPSRLADSDVYMDHI